MTKTRSQTAEEDHNKMKSSSISDAPPHSPKPVKSEEEIEKPPPQKKAKSDMYTTGVIERGHIYFLYRPKVQREEAKSLDEVKNVHMLLVPRPPKFSTYEKGISKPDNEVDETAEMKVVAAGADAVPAPQALDEPKKRFRLITIGKKRLPDPEGGGVSKGRKETFWATVTSVGNDLRSLQQGLGERTYETKTRGTRHEAPARLAARGAYAFVNNDPELPSKRATHFGYHISHPREIGGVQKELGIGKAASFVIQVKNPLAPATNPRQVHNKGAEYPKDIMKGIFGKGGRKGRESYGLRFATCAVPELLDYKGAELLLIAARRGEEGLERSLGEGRGKGRSRP
ncbi:hypothetical protein H0H87_004560 [Tephrocybe sp. NHM501043]|nr:hypothetical protein H0H87_004560 [Tephrocybe sp. NHM501043]